MRNLWRRLLVKLGIRRKPQVIKASNIEISILGPDGKPVVIGALKGTISYGPACDLIPFYELGSEKKTYIAGKQEFKGTCHVVREAK